MGIMLWLLLGMGIAGILTLIFHTFYVKTSQVKVEASCSPLTIVHLSELHGRTRFLNGALHRLVNRFEPDLIVVTGDLAQHFGQLERVLKELGRMKSKDGIFFVPGNYEREQSVGLKKKKYSPEAYEASKIAWKEKMVILENAAFEIEKDKSCIQIYGFDNSVYGNERYQQMKLRSPVANLTILLAHSPKIISFVKEHHIRANLLLTGHTHGGQIRIFGRTFGEYKHFHIGQKADETVGLFCISRGLGTSRLP